MKQLVFKNVTVQFTLHDAFTTDQCIEILQNAFDNINKTFEPGGGLSVTVSYNENLIEIYNNEK